MNREKLRAKAVNVYEAKSDIFNVVLFDKGPAKLLDLVIDEDRSKLIPYIEDEIKAAYNLGQGAEKYINELTEILAIVKEEIA